MLRLAGLSLALAIACRGQGIITTVAGTSITYPGTSFSANSASFGALSGVAVSPVDGGVYFASQTQSMIFRFDPTLNSVTIVAGIGYGGYSGDGGPAIGAALNTPQQLAFDSAGNLYIADEYNDVIREIDTQGIITTFVQLPNNDAALGVAFGPDGTLYASSYGQVFHLGASGKLTQIAGGTTPGYGGDNGPATSALLNCAGIAVDGAGNVYVADQQNNRIRKISTNGIITTFAGNGQTGASPAGPATASPVQNPEALTFDSAGNLWTGSGISELLKIDPSQNLTLASANNDASLFVNAPGPLSKAFTSWAQGLAFDGGGNLYFSDNFDGYLWEVTSAGTVQVAAGNAPGFALGDGGPALVAGLAYPQQLWMMPDGSMLVIDRTHNRIREISPAGIINTVVGDGIEGFTNPGAALAISLFGPNSIGADSSGNIFVDTGPIMEVNPAGVATTYYQSSYYAPPGIFVDSQGNLLVASNSDSVFLLTPSGSTTQIAGNGTAGFSGDGKAATSAQLNNPQAVARPPNAGTPNVEK